MKAVHILCSLEAKLLRRRCHAAVLSVLKWEGVGSSLTSPILSNLQQTFVNRDPQFSPKLCAAGFLSRKYWLGKRMVRP